MHQENINTLRVRLNLHSNLSDRVYGWPKKGTVWGGEFGVPRDWCSDKLGRWVLCFYSWGRYRWSSGPLLDEDLPCCTSNTALVASLSVRAQSSTYYKDLTDLFRSSPDILWYTWPLIFNLDWYQSYLISVLYLWSENTLITFFLALFYTLFIIYVECHLLRVK